MAAIDWKSRSKLTWWNSKKLQLLLVIDNKDMPSKTLKGYRVVLQKGIGDNKRELLNTGLTKTQALTFSKTYMETH